MSYDLTNQRAFLGIAVFLSLDWLTCPKATDLFERGKMFQSLSQQLILIDDLYVYELVVVQRVDL